MSKARQITGVQVDVKTNGSVWVSVFWDGKPRYIADDGTEICGRNYYSTNPERRARLVKRARQMQGLIMGHWYKGPKRIVAMGDRNGFTAVDIAAFDEDDQAVIRILEGPTVQDEAVGRFNALLANANWEAVDYDTAVGYLESNDFDPWAAYLEFGRDNPDWHEEALTAAERNR